VNFHEIFEAQFTKVFGGGLVFGAGLLLRKNRATCCAEPTKYQGYPD
jgi:hypothetical protein